MQELAPSTPSLDALAAAALEGDRQAEGTLFELLRARFAAIAKHRVRDDDRADVVQDALRIVHARYGEVRAQGAILPWSLVVLRNVIGNYYQAHERTSGQVAYDEGMHGTPTASAAESQLGRPDLAYESAQTTELVFAAISQLGRSDSRCGRVFRHILEGLEAGGGPREISQQVVASLRRDYPDMSRGNVYVTLHRCRSRLRAILEEMARDPDRPGES